MRKNLGKLFLKIAAWLLKYSYNDMDYFEKEVFLLANGRYFSIKKEITNYNNDSGRRDVNYCSYVEGHSHCSSDTIKGSIKSLKDEIEQRKGNKKQSIDI